MAQYQNDKAFAAYDRQREIKQVCEQVIALLLIQILLPVFALIALAIRLESRGPILFVQNRTGEFGKVFRIYKFRTMLTGSGLEQATRDDARVTKVGAFLRKTSLDELPQLFNVLRGEMALVGPRPHAVPHDEYYASKIDGYMSRYDVKPGMTGLAQICGARGETATVDKMAQRIELDLRYISAWSINTDLKILFATPIAVLVSDAAY